MIDYTVMMLNGSCYERRSGSTVLKYICEAHDKEALEAYHEKKREGTEPSQEEIDALLDAVANDTEIDSPGDMVNKCLEAMDPLEMPEGLIHPNEDPEGEIKTANDIINLMKEENDNVLSENEVEALLKENPLEEI